MQRNVRQKYLQAEYKKKDKKLDGSPAFGKVIRY